MKINYSWQKDYALNEIGVTLNPQNQHLTVKIENDLHLEVIVPSNQRCQQLKIKKIFLIEAMDNLSKVYTVNNEVYYTKGRLKELEKYKSSGLVRINNSTILNLKQVVSFKNGKYARLEVHTKDGQFFIVSRHYAKQIQEELR